MSDGVVYVIVARPVERLRHARVAGYSVFGEVHLIAGFVEPGP